MATSRPGPPTRSVTRSSRPPGRSVPPQGGAGGLAGEGRIEPPTCPRTHRGDPFHVRPHLQGLEPFDVPVHEHKVHSTMVARYAVEEGEFAADVGPVAPRLRVQRSPVADARTVDA